MFSPLELHLPTLLILDTGISILLGLASMGFWKFLVHRLSGVGLGEGPWGVQSFACWMFAKCAIDLRSDELGLGGHVFVAAAN